MKTIGTISMADAAKNVTLTFHVTGINIFRFRMWLGKQFIRIGVAIIFGERFLKVPDGILEVALAGFDDSPDVAKFAAVVVDFGGLLH